MLIAKDQYVNIHAHRAPASPHEWVLRNLASEDYPPDQDPEASYSVGLHPWDIDKVDIPHTLKKIQLATENCQVLALGEAGLDKMKGVSMDLQLKVFKAHADLAALVEMPLIIHAVKADQELIKFAKEEKPSIPMVIHGYMGNTTRAMELLKHGFQLSFGESLLLSQKSREAYAALPLESTFLETDISDRSIREIYRAAAELKKIGVEELCRIMAERANNLLTRK
ncbi:MAG: TatD family hydrolase [Bacteroidales bacterium]